MELQEWCIDPNDLHFLTQRRHGTCIRNVKAVGEYLLRGRKFASCSENSDDDDPIILGKSVYFTIYLAEWRGLLVAVKRLDMKETDMKHMSVHLQHEIGILVKMHHPNIVQILGITLEPFQIVLEYFPMRDLVHVQKNHRLMCSFFSKKMKWTCDLLLALIYLHERRPQSVIHRDLKPSNLLITSEGTLKITDFGLSKLRNDFYQHKRLPLSNNSLITNDQQNHTAEEHLTYDIGTYWYMSPELRSKTPYDNKMDIWSLGLILYEIWEQCRIYNIISEPTVLIEKNPDRKNLLHFTGNTPPMMKDLIIQCLSLDPDLRPTVRHILAAVCHMKRPLFYI